VDAGRVAAQWRAGRGPLGVRFDKWWQGFVSDALASLRRADDVETVATVVRVEAKLIELDEDYGVKVGPIPPMLDLIEEAEGDKQVAIDLLLTAQRMKPQLGAETTYVVFGNAKVLPGTPFLRAYAVQPADGVLWPDGVSDEIFDHVAEGRMAVWKVQAKEVGVDANDTLLVTDLRGLTPISCEDIGLDCAEPKTWDLPVTPDELDLIKYRGLDTLYKWFAGIWMRSDSIDRSDVEALKALAKLAPRPRRTKLYRVIGIWSKHDCSWFETARNKRIQTSNKKMQSWARTLKGAQWFYRNVRQRGTGLGAESPPPEGRGDGTAVWLIVESEVPVANVVLDWRSILEALKKLDAYFAATGDAAWDKTTTTIRFLDKEWYKQQQEVVVYLSTKKATANRFHVLSCEE
jgi:hypothetical protein